MRLMAFVLFCCAANTATAQLYADKENKFYVGIGANYVDANVNNLDGDKIGSISFRSLELHGGYKHSSYLNVEARVGTGLTEETVETTFGSAQSTLDSYASLYWRPESANKSTKIYGLLGFTSISASQSDTSRSDSGLSYGFGVGFAIKTNWNLNIEYRQLLNNDDNQLSAFGASVDYRF